MSHENNLMSLIHVMLRLFHVCAHDSWHRCQLPQITLFWQGLHVSLTCCRDSRSIIKMEWKKNSKESIGTAMWCSMRKDEGSGGGRKKLSFMTSWHDRDMEILSWLCMNMFGTQCHAHVMSMFVMRPLWHLPPLHSKLEHKRSTHIELTTRSTFINVELWHVSTHKV